MNELNVNYNKGRIEKIKEEIKQTTRTRRVLQSPQNPFIVIDEIDYDNLNDKTNNTLYIVKEENIRKVTIVIKYTVIQYREMNGILIQSMRQMEGENLLLPEVGVLRGDTGTRNIYYFFENWVRANGTILTSNDIVPVSDTTYYARRLEVSLPKVASIEAVGNSESGQSMIEDFIIETDHFLYLRNTPYYHYLVRPTVFNYIIANQKYTRVSFKIDGLDSTASSTIVLKPEFTLYKDNNYQERIGQVTIPINIYKSDEPSGD